MQSSRRTTPRSGSTSLFSCFSFPVLSTVIPKASTINYRPFFRITSEILNSDTALSPRNGSYRRERKDIVTETAAEQRLEQCFSSLYIHTLMC